MRAFSKAAIQRYVWFPTAALGPRPKTPENALRVVQGWSSGHVGPHDNGPRYVPTGRADFGQLLMFSRYMSP
jgi:hypothetical protein